MLNKVSHRLSASYLDIRGIYCGGIEARGGILGILGNECGDYFDF